MSRLQGLRTIGVGLFSVWAMLAPAWASDLGRSWPKDTTPYSRPAVPEDHAPGGRQPLGPATTSPVNVQRIVDAVVNNTDPTLKNSDAFNDGEISIAINPLNPDEIVMSAYSGMWTTYTPAAPLWHSTDGGQTWTKGFVIDRPNVDGTTFCPCNQTVDFGRQNRLFYGVITVNPNHVYAGGPTGAALTGWQWPFVYGATIMRADNATSLGQTDQPWMLMNRDPVNAAQDNLYIAYDDFGSNPVAMRVSTSRGTPPINFVTDTQAGSSSGGVNPGLRLAKDPRNGHMYTIFQNCVSPGCLVSGSNVKTIEYVLNRSTDAGMTWTLNGSSTGIVVATAESTQPLPKFGTVNALLGGVVHGTVDPSNGDVYYVYGSRNPATGHNRLAVRRLVDNGAGGLTIGAEHLVTGEVEAALPAVAVTDNGAVGVFHYTFDGFSGGFPQFTTHLAVSFDRGVTFTDQPLLTFLSSTTDDGTIAQRVFGDYMQMKAVGNCFYGGFTGNGVPFGRTVANHDPIFFKACVDGTPAVTLSTSLGSVVAGGSVTATWSGISSPTSTDWIGLYAPGAPNTSYLAWVYVSCSQTPGAAAASGSCALSIPGGLPSGTYELRLLSNNGYTLLASSNSFSVTGSGPTVSMAPASVPAGGSVTATWSGIPSPTTTDWIGLYAPGAPNTAYLAWIYVSCSKTPGAPAAAGACAFTIPSSVTPGTYELRLLANNGFTALTTSGALTVMAAGPGLSANPPTVARGHSVTATWSAIPSPTPTDWIGLYARGAADTAYLTWIYVSCSQTPGVAAASGSCPFTIPGTLTPGTYELRLFSNNGYTRLATSNPLTVD